MILHDEGPGELIAFEIADVCLIAHREAEDPASLVGLLHFRIGPLVVVNAPLHHTEADGWVIGFKPDVEYDSGFPYAVPVDEGAQRVITAAIVKSLRLDR